MEQASKVFAERERANALERRAIFAEANHLAGRELESLCRVVNAQPEKRLREIMGNGND